MEKNRFFAQKLQVFLNNHYVGYVQQLTKGIVEFQYDYDWLNDKNALPISLSLPLCEEKYSGERVNAVFDNLLPDQEAIRTKIAARVGAKSTRPFDLLAAIGHDCVGALQFLPENMASIEIGKIEGQPVSEKKIAHILKHLAQIPLGLNKDAEFRISLAGAQEKTALLYFNKQWMLPLGTTATTHIFKPQIGKLRNGIDLTQSVENEFFCLEFLYHLQVPCARSRIHDFEDEKVLIIERFDRLWKEDGQLIRIPQEDMCQALGVFSHRKYESDGGPRIKDILKLLIMSDEAAQDRMLFLKVQIIYWLLAATDGHAKNFSIALYPQQRFKLTPMYDVMSAQPYLDQGQIQHNKMKMALSIGSNRHYVVYKILPRHFLQTAQDNGIPLKSFKKMIEELIIQVPIALEKTLSSLTKDFPTFIAVSIEKGIRKRLNLLADSLSD